MANVDKIIEKMKNQPNGIRMSEADKVLTANGYRLDRQKGSHHQYINCAGRCYHSQGREPAQLFMSKIF